MPTRDQNARVRKHIQNKQKQILEWYIFIVRMIYIKYTFMCLYIRKQERYSPGFHMSDYGNDRKILMSNLLY